jgi:DNA invertase Pin-like site-specific DNA recombinase
MKRVAIYTRISTNEEMQDSTQQTHHLEEYVKNRGWELLELYQDEASGRSNKRPRFNQLKKDAKKRKFDVVLVFRFDRYARSTVELISSLNEFNELGIDFVSFNEGIDTTTPAGKAMFGMIAVFAEFESAVTGTRVKASISKWKSDNPEKTWGRQQVEKMKYQDVIMSDLAEGVSQRKVAKFRGVSLSHVQRVKKRGLRDD